MSVSVSSVASSMNNNLYLPADVLHSIAKYMPSADLYNWYKCCNLNLTYVATRQLRKREMFLELGDLGDDDLPTLHSVMAGFATSVGISFTDRYRLPWLTAFLGACPLLRELSLYSAPSNWWQQASLVFAQLHTLKLYDMQDTDEVIGGLLQLCNTGNLRHLRMQNLSGISSTYLDRAPLSLDTLEMISNPFACFPRPLVEYVRRNPSLRKIIVGHITIYFPVNQLCPNIQLVSELRLDSNIIHAGHLANLERLQCLKVHFSQNELDNYLQQLGTTDVQQQLRELHIRFDYEVDLSRVKCMANLSKLTKLHTLTIDYIGQLYHLERLLDELAKSQRNLRSFTLFANGNCMPRKPLTIDWVCRSLPKLQHLQIDLKPSGELLRFAELKDLQSLHLTIKSCWNSGGTKRGRRENTGIQQMLQALSQRNQVSELYLHFRLGHPVELDDGLHADLVKYTRLRDCTIYKLVTTTDLPKLRAALVNSTNLQITAFPNRVCWDDEVD